VVSDVVKGMTMGVIVHGKNGISKTNTLFGYGSKYEKGICLRFAADIFLDRVTEKDSLELFVSFFTLDSTRLYDLTTSTPLIVYIGTQGDKKVESEVTQARVKNEEEVLTVIKNGLLCRKRLKDHVQGLEQNGHLIFVFTIKEPDESFEQGRIRSKVYLVELLEPKNNYKDADYVSLETTIKALNESKNYLTDNFLIKTLQNLFKEDNRLCLIGHIEGKFIEKATYTVQFAERCNNKKATKDLLVNDLEMLNRAYKKEIEEIETDYVSGLNYLKKLCELNVDLVKIANKGPSSSESVCINNFRQANERLDNYRIRKTKLEEKLVKANQTIAKVKEKISTKKSYFKELISKLTGELENLNKHLVKLKKEYEGMPSKMSKEVEKARLSKTEEISIKVKEKIGVLFNIDEVIEYNNNEMFEATKLYQHYTNNLKEKYYEEVRRNKEITLRDYSKLIDKYESELNAKKEELTTVMQQTKVSCIEDRLHVRQYRKEVILLASLIRKRERILNEEYKGGMYSMAFPRSHKISFISKASFHNNSRSISTSMTKSRIGKLYSRPNTSLQYGY